MSKTNGSPNRDNHVHLHSCSLSPVSPAYEGKDLIRAAVATPLGGPCPIPTSQGAAGLQTDAA